MDAIRTRTEAVTVTSDGVSELPVAVALTYRPDDPYAVTVELSTAGDSVTWLFGRSLLADGTVTATGEGDVRVEPLGNGAVVVQLRSPEGAVEVHLRRDDVMAFLESSLELVPRSRESEWLATDFDAELRLLSETMPELRS